jgi:hypothetical protein
MTIEELKEEICGNYCKYLAESNKVEFTSLDELQQLTDAMADICANCPLNRV